MIGMTQQTIHLLIMSLENDHPYLQFVYQQGNGAGTVVVDNPDDAQDCLESQRFDAIVAPHTPEAVAFLETIFYGKQRLRPVICILTDENWLYEDLPADIVLPPLNPSFIDHQLRTHLQYRQSMLKLKSDQDEINLLKNAIVRNVSHELKTPLLQVKAAVALIAEDITADQSLSQMAVLSTARLETVIKNITLLADGLNGNFGPVLVSESVSQAIRNLRRNWLHKDSIARVHTIYEDSLPPVLADKQGLGVIMQQLVDNALKFSQDNVEIRAKSCETGVKISVRDYGIGIAEDKHKQIFDSFYQVDSSATRRYGGTGVGLAIVRLILDKHNVDIHVESRLGSGSEFWFVLPKAEL